MQNFDALKILGSLLASGALSRGSGSNVLGSIIGAVLGGGKQGSTTGSGSSFGGGGGGLGDLIGGMLGGGRQSSPSQGGGLDDLLGGLLGGGGGRQVSGGGMGGGGIGDLIGMAMKQFGAAQQGSSLGFADLNQEMPNNMDYRQAEDQATLLIKAMINAAKADGQVDREEQEKIIGKLGDITPEETDFVRNQIASPLDTQGFIRSIPQGLEQQVYTVSLMAIDLDTNTEARYLHELAQGTGISPEISNQIHQKLGVPKIYR